MGGIRPLAFERPRSPERLMFRARRSGGEPSAALELIRSSRAGIASRTRSGELMTLSVFADGPWLYLYYERLLSEAGPGDLFPGLERLLSSFPEGEEGFAAWLPMEPVFHFNEPRDPGHWERKAPVSRRVGRIARLKPGALASYAYFHFALQEEQAFPGNKYEFIGLDRNWLFLYRELPAVVEAPLHQRGLEGRSTPEDWSTARIPDHFELTPDGISGFRDMELVLAL